ncbi:unnamed protein product [Thelazia callipaeda]|uniref:Kunitz/Bovine pancreatic trypsin inhibitor domain protein n=1 Tax=Thelazia callipaeda TaxID=103827 RepID=A0A158RC57_THECL|nr:unnamed protein product [Thelazia callipaeda]
MLKNKQGSLIGSTSPFVTQSSLTVYFSQIPSMVFSLTSECDPSSQVRKPSAVNNNTYFYCDSQGQFSLRKCPDGNYFNTKLLECMEEIRLADEADPFLLPQFQAPEDLCGNGTPLTRLSAPVVCNPSISSCPDGYSCTKYGKTGTAYCCQGAGDETEDAEYYCQNDEVTYFKNSNGKPQICSVRDESSCPPGFSCTLIRNGAVNNDFGFRCCGKHFGCPPNSAAQINRKTNSFVICSSVRSCENGFACVPSTTANANICCSDTNFAAQKVCPAGKPLYSGPTSCSEKSPCPNGYFCVTSNKKNYCCPSQEKICHLPQEAGECGSDQWRVIVTRYYFDTKTGTCRLFNYSGCNGNDNNFESMEQCQSFCLAQQCEVGVAYRMDAVNAACSPQVRKSCPEQFTCQEPVFGPVSICCPDPQKVCNEAPSAGTTCFGKSMTTRRYYFDQKRQKCQAFDYYGCSGNSNNFRNETQCEDFCLFNAEQVCDSSAALKDPSGRLQKCNTFSTCPSGYYCNKKQYCCPTPVPMSSGNLCSMSRKQTAWYYNAVSESCLQFTYLGCDGTANRFTSEEACMMHCAKNQKLGKCPLGMSLVLDDQKTLPRTCKLNIAGSCPEWSSCVPSSTNTPICCTTEAKCPDHRIPYVIPNSDSFVSCRPDNDICPTSSDCMESSVPGFYMCCLQSTGNALDMVSEPEAVCPENLASNGQTCDINADVNCPKGYTCLNHLPSRNGLCCKARPVCLKGKTYYTTRRKAHICGQGLEVCPKGTACLISSVPNINICCKFASHPSATSRFLRPNVITPLCSNDRIPFYDPGKQCLTSHRGQCPANFSCQVAKSGGLYYCCPVSPNECINGHKAYTPPGSSVPQTCSIKFNSCPPGYSCHPSVDGSTTFCCLDLAAAAECPVGSSAYLYANRPLACPPGSNRCPNGYTCTRSTVYSVHLCCSASLSPVLMCAGGIAYIEPVTSEPQQCSPLMNNCPPGYLCQESTSTGHYLCCTSGHLNTLYTGYCPIGQIPYVRYANEEPSTCHMTLRPCPTTAQYLCIYSAEKLDSYCCAPIDTTFIAQPETIIQSETLSITGDAQSGCPVGSQPLLDHWNRIQSCNPELCPQTYACYYSAQHTRYQCCSSLPENFQGALGFAADPVESICERGSAKKGCEENDQCSMRVSEARCERGYCVCPRNKLIHQSKCVTHCPEGFIDIAARCRDLTTIVFMDSVDERTNGTIGGFCKNTVIVEEQCDVNGSYCNEITVTCQCKPGYELNFDMDNRNDTGSCVKMEESKYAHQTSDKLDNSASIGVSEQMDNDNNIWFNSTRLSIENIELEDDADDLGRYLLQTDDATIHGN